MFLADGVSKIKCTKEITDHTKSCFYIYKQFYPDFLHKITETETHNIIEIKGFIALLKG
jgi:hypothetical protein